MTATVLHDFNRRVRDEPMYYIYKHRIYVTKNEVNAEEVEAWLRARYVDAKRGHRYRVATYNSTDGKRYVDQILLETCNDDDLVTIKLRWGYSLVKVARGDRVPRRRLTKEQKASLDALIARTREEYFASLG